MSENKEGLEYKLRWLNNAMERILLAEKVVYEETKYRLSYSNKKRNKSGVVE